MGDSTMLMLVAGMIGGMGLVCVISRRTLLGMMVGLQLLILGASMMFVLAGIASSLGPAEMGPALADSRIQGHVVALFVVLGGVAQLAAGYALVIRLFYVKNKIEINELRTLKQ